MTICHGIPWYRNGADDHCPFSIEGWWLFFYPLSYLTLTKCVTIDYDVGVKRVFRNSLTSYIVP